MHYRCRRWRWLLMHGSRRWRVHIMFRLPLRTRCKSLRQRIVLPFRLCWRRAIVVRTLYRFGRWLMVIA